MPARHSKNTGSRPHFTYHEKSKAFGSVTQRLGGESQLPFGYCALSLSPAEDAVVSPSGRLYGREYILEYILTKTQELKKQQREFEEQQVRTSCVEHSITCFNLPNGLLYQVELRRREETKVADQTAVNVSKFIETHDGVKSTLKRKANEVEPVRGYIDTTRLKKFDDTDDTERRQKLSQSAPWVPQFTPQAQETVLKEPPKRPPSPFSGRPLRSKDLVSIELVKESEGSADSSIVKYICPVSRYVQ